MYECECCHLPLCKEKLPGIGYYCDACFSVCYMDHLDNCNPNWRHHNTEWRTGVLHQVMSLPEPGMVGPRSAAVRSGVAASTSRSTP